MKLTTKKSDQSERLCAATELNSAQTNQMSDVSTWRVELKWGKRMLHLVRPETGNEVHLYWYSYPENKLIMSWDKDTSIQEIMDFIVNLPEKRESTAFTLP